MLCEMECMNDSINESLSLFKDNMLDIIIQESEEILNIIKSIKEEKEKIVNMKSESKILYMASQHMEIIRENMKEQLYEMRELIDNLEKEEIVKMEEQCVKKRKMDKEKEYIHRAYKIFLPYILVCAICLRINQNQNS